MAWAEDVAAMFRPPDGWRPACPCCPHPAAKSSHGEPLDQSSTINKHLLPGTRRGLVHHVDLRAGFGPGDWPADFVETMLGTVVSAFAGRDDVPELRLVASDSGRSYELGARRAARVVRGPQAQVLAWLLGRSDGADLGDSLPAPPFLY